MQLSAGKIQTIHDTRWIYAINEKSPVAIFFFYKNRDEYVKCDS
jgi:hypothetical protein